METSSNDKLSKVTRNVTILKIEAIEILNPEEKGVTLNEGYTFEVDGALPQLADGIAKMALEMDRDTSFGINGGSAFLTLIDQFYNKLKSEEGGN